MAVQNALVRISLKDAPTTAVMTSRAKARERAKRILPTILGFAAGCGLGAAAQAAFGLWSLLLPASLALLAIAMPPWRRV
jgi:uncharacterized membrane protein YoaK (UPF0700 family)